MTIYLISIENRRSEFTNGLMKKDSNQLTGHGWPNYHDYARNMR